jgi:hypothetical protein
MKKEFPKHLTIILKEMCQRVGADFNKIDFKKKDWQETYQWTEKKQEDFKRWLIDYLYKNKEAIKEFCRYPSIITTKKEIEKAVSMTKSKKNRLTTNYRRGANKEYEWINTLKEIQNERGLSINKDYIIQRSSGSHSPFDVVMWNFYDGEIHAFQIKYLSDEKKLKYEKSGEEFNKFKNLEPIISLWKHYIIFIKGIKEPIFLWSEK